MSHHRPQIEVELKGLEDLTIKALAESQAQWEPIIQAQLDKALSEDRIRQLVTAKIEEIFKRVIEKEITHSLEYNTEFRRVIRKIILKGFKDYLEKDL